MESNETDDRQWHQQINTFTYEDGSNSTDNSYNISSVNTTSGWGVSPVPPAVTATFGIVGNIVAILVLFRSSRIHKWKTFYRLVCALAVTDLFGIISTTPVVLLVYANGIQFIGGQPVCDYLAFMMVFAGIATLLIVTTMSFDRFVAVWHPYAYSSTLTHKRIFVTLLLIWFIATMLGSLPIFGFGHNILQYPGTWCFFNFYSRQIVDSIFCILYSGVGLLVISFTTIMNILVSVKIRTTKRRPRKLSDHQVRTCRSNASQIIFLIAISVVFSICWLPLMIRVILNQMVGHSTNKWADLLVVRMASINQILNPWIYILLRKEFFKGMCTLRRRIHGSLRRNKSNSVKENHKSLTSDDNGNNIDSQSHRDVKTQTLTNPESLANP